VLSCGPKEGVLVACWLLPAAIRRQCWRRRRDAPSSTTTTDRTQRGRLLRPAGGPRVDAPRRGRQADGTTAAPGARAAGSAREVLAYAPSPAPRASARPGRCIIEATVSRKVRRGCSRSRPGRRTDPPGGCFARLKEQRAHGAQRDCSVTDSAVRPVRRRMLASRPERSDVLARIELAVLTRGIASHNRTPAGSFDSRQGGWHDADSSHCPKSDPKASVNDH
jgi:hypothetical protein